MLNFSEISRKNVIYDNIESHKKAELHTPSRRHVLASTIGRVKLIYLCLLGVNPPAKLGMPTNESKAEIETQPLAVELNKIILSV